MTWSIASRRTFTDWESDWLYIYDTYLPTKGWTVGSNDFNGTGTREIEKDVTNIWTGGTETLHWWLGQPNGSNPSWYASLAAGSTAISVFSSIGPNVSSATEWQFWDSTSDPTQVLITFGKSVAFYWPGDSARWFLRGTHRSGTADGKNTYIFPAGGTTNAWITKGYQADPSDPSSTNHYGTVAYIGFPGEDAPGGTNYPDVPIGAKFMRITNPILTVGAQSAVTGDNTAYYSALGPIVQLNVTDSLLQFGCTSTSRPQRLYLGSLLGFDGTNYWLGSSTSSNYLVFDLGTTEPIF